MHRVVITGLGMSTSLGPDLRTCWRRLVAGENGIGPITFWDPAEYNTKVAGQVAHVPAEDPASPERASRRRSMRLFVPVAREAWTDAGLDRVPVERTQAGMAIGTSVNYLDMRLLKQYFQLRCNGGRRQVLDMRRIALEHSRCEGSLMRRLGDTIAGAPARLLGIGGPVIVTDTACAASAHAIGEAFRMIQRGRAKVMLAGGSAALISPISILAFALLGALSRSSDPDAASRPFDRRRDGFVMGEGAGAVVLESLESARARGARIHAELAGCGLSTGAHNLTDPSPDGAAEAHAMSQALRDASLQPEEIGYVAAHGTATPKNDVVETTAIKRVFGAHARRLLVSSNKGQIGHTISAAGVSNLIGAVQAITESRVPPTMHLREPDPQCDLDYVANQSRPAPVRAALANAFAFGGQNAVLAVRAYEISS